MFFFSYSFFFLFFFFGAVDFYFLPLFNNMGLLLLFSRPVVSDSWRPHGLQLARPPCPSPSPEVCLSSCPLHEWCHPAIQPSHPLMPSSPSVLSLSHHQGLFQWVKLFASDDQNTGLSALHQSFPMRIQSWFPLRLTGLISLLSKGLSGVFSSTTVQRHQFFGAPPSLRSSLTTVHAHWEDHSLDCMDLCRQSNVSDSQHTV